MCIKWITGDQIYHGIHLTLSWFHPNRRTSLSATYIKKWHVRDCYHLSPLLMTLGARKMVLWYGIWHRMNETSTVHNTLQNIFCWLSLSFIFLKFILLLVTVEKEVYKGSLCLLTETWPRTEDIFCVTLLLIIESSLHWVLDRLHFGSGLTNIWSIVFGSV